MRVLTALLLLLSGWVLPQSPQAQDDEPPVFSKAIRVIDNGNPIRLRWTAGDEGLQVREQVMLFVPGPVASASAEVVAYEWIARATEVHRGDQTTFAEQNPTRVEPRVLLEEIGPLHGSRLAVLTLRAGSREENPTLVFSSGDILLTFHDEDPDPPRSIGRLLQPVYDTYAINTPTRATPPATPVAEPLHITEARAHDDGSHLLRWRSREEGMVAIPGADLIAALGQAPRVEHLFGARHEKAVALLVLNEALQAKVAGPLENTDRVWFFQPASTSPYSTDIVTWLGTAPADSPLIARMGFASTLTDPDTPPEPDTVARLDLFLEEDNEFIRESDTNTRQNEFWMWARIEPGHPVRVSMDESVPAGAIIQAMSFTLRSDPAGFVPSASAMVIRIGDTPIHPTITPGEHGIMTLHADALGLPVDENHRAMELSWNPTSSQRIRQTLYLDRMSLTLEATPHARPEPWMGDAIAVPEGAYAFAIHDSVQGNGLSVAPGTVMIPPNPLPTTVYLVSDEEILSGTLEPVSPSTLKPVAPEDVTDLLLITHERFAASLARYVDALQRDGIRATIVTSQFLYDRFGDGRTDPHAIQRGIAHYCTTADVPPSAVLLVGDATWDTWKRYDSPAENLVPGYRGHPLYATENWFVQVDGTGDPLPDLMIGRWAVRSVDELERVIDQSIRYRATPPVPDWSNHVYLLTDHGFERFMDELDADWIPPAFQKTRRHIADYPLIDNIYLPSRLRGEMRAKTSLEATEDTIRILNRGVMLWAFFGHGAPNVIGNERIFFGGGSRFTDVKKLDNTDRPFVVWSFSCETTSFDYPRDKWYISIGEDLLTHPGSGCVALFGATGRGYPHDHIWLARGMADAAFHQGLPNLGQQIMAGHLAGLAQMVPFEPKDQFALLGDPTLSLPRTIPLDGVLVAEGDDVRYRWQVPEALQSADTARVWVQAEQGIPWQETTAVSDAIEGVWQRRSAGDSTLESLGVHLVARHDGQWVIGHGAVPFPAADPAPVIEASGDRLPDLAFVEGSIRVEPRRPREGETVFLDARIENRGRATAEQIEVRGFRLRDNQRVPLAVVVGRIQQTIDRLDPRESRRVRVRWDPFQNAGEHAIELQIDERDRIAESNETNNVFSLSLDVRNKSDLVVDATGFVLEPRENGAGYFMDFVVRNEGESEATRIVVEMAAGVQGRQEPVRVRPEPMYTERLDAGQSRTMNRIALPPTLEWVEIRIDPDELVDESTHENNVFRYEIR